ncbi:MAG TPA: UbiA family prenyltransferase [Caldilineae bacterium]|nr:UbiA family prenyltransferase [Caldilineae bacterium]
MMKQVRLFLEMIKFEHTIFALPFAYLGMVLAARGWPTWHQFLWITIAMVAARTLAMSVNRVADRHFDARNPRTAQRALPRGLLTPAQVWGAAGISLAVFLLSAWQLNDFVLRLAPLAVIALVGYSYTKRFTWLSHWILGMTDGAAAAGAWAAVRASLNDPIPWLLWGAVTVWIAGFDLIYACQDVAFDREMGLQAVPARFGVATALRWAKICHILTIILLAAVGWVAGLGWVYWLGMLSIAILLAYEHSLVRPDDLSRVDVAFFNMNGYISVTTFLATLIAILMRT